MVSDSLLSNLCSIEFKCHLFSDNEWKRHLLLTVELGVGKQSVHLGWFLSKCSLHRGNMGICNIYLGKYCEISACFTVHRYNNLLLCWLKTAISNIYTLITFNRMSSKVSMFLLNLAKLIYSNNINIPDQTRTVLVVVPILGCDLAVRCAVFYNSKYLGTKYIWQEM